EGAPVLQARQIGRKGLVQPTDLDIHAGEIVGVAGLLGSGRTELARRLFGLERADGGELSVNGARARLDSPAEAIALGIALCPEERKTEGLVLALQARAGLVPALTVKEQRAIAERLVKALGIKTASLETPVGQLSGGNQQ